MKLIIITGVSKGLGNALTKLLLKKRNYHILGISRSNVNFKSLQFKHLKIDLANPISCEAAFENYFSSVINFEEIIFINNAGIVQPIEKIANLKRDDIVNNININLLSPIVITKKLLSIGKLVHIINISSGAAVRPIEGWSQYCMTKAGTKMFFEVYQKENPNSKVLHIDPGVIDTDMQKSIRKTSSTSFPLVENFINLKKDKKLQPPSEVAQNIFNKMKNENLI